jgi:hypothetical protein
LLFLHILLLEWLKIEASEEFFIANSNFFTN